jgi:hypothetical protein
LWSSCVVHYNAKKPPAPALAHPRAEGGTGPSRFDTPAGARNRAGPVLEMSRVMAGGGCKNTRESLRAREMARQCTNDHAEVGRHKLCSSAPIPLRPP